MNVVQDMLFQQMQMLAAGMSLPQTGGSDGKTNFQSVMDQTRGESQAVKEPEKQQNTEETEKTEPVQEETQPTEEEETDPIRLQEAYSAMGVMQLFRVVPQETEETAEKAALVEAVPLEGEVIPETEAPLPAAELPEAPAEQVPELQTAADQEVQPQMSQETAPVEESGFEVQIKDVQVQTEERPVEVKAAEDEEP